MCKENTDGVVVAIEAACKPADEYNKENCPINLPKGFIRLIKV